MDLAVREEGPFEYAGRTGRVVSMAVDGEDMVDVVIEVEDPPLLGVPGEPPGAEDA
jgi:hypothetical protein